MRPTEMIEGKTINNVDFGNATKAQRIATSIAGGIFSLIALISFLGYVPCLPRYVSPSILLTTDVDSFIGACFRKYALVKLYSASTWILVFASAAASGFFYYFAYSGKDVFNGCEVKDQQGQEHECRIILKTWQKILFTIITVVLLLIFVCTYA